MLKGRKGREGEVNDKEERDIDLFYCSFFVKKIKKNFVGKKKKCECTYTASTSIKKKQKKKFG